MEKYSNDSVVSIPDGLVASTSPADRPSNNSSEIRLTPFHKSQGQVHCTQMLEEEETKCEGYDPPVEAELIFFSSLCVCLVFKLLTSKSPPETNEREQL